MKKAGLYDQYRYPNRLHQSVESFDTRGDHALGSGPRGVPSVRTAGTAYKIAGSNSAASSFDVYDQADLLPTRRRVSSLGWGSLVFQIFSMLLVIVVFLGPGWGRSESDLRKNTERSIVYNYHGFWLLCTEQVVGFGQTCVNNLLVDYQEGWWISVQALGCVFLVLTLIALILITVYVFRIKSNRKWTLSLTYGLVCILNCVVMVSCIVLFAVKFLDNSWWCCPQGHRIIDSILFWAWYLAIAALLSQTISAVMAIVETVRLRR